MNGDETIATVTAAEKVQATAVALGVSITSKFVPWSLSRSAGEKSPSLNWKVTLLVKGREVLTVDYGAGAGHCPSYQPRATNDITAAVRNECETGKLRGAFAGKAINPALADVLASLAGDAEAIDYPTFGQWVENYGYDLDSRMAEGIYRACVEVGLKLRAALGEEGLKALREAVAGY